MNETANDLERRAALDRWNLLIRPPIVFGKTKISEAMLQRAILAGKRIHRRVRQLKI